MYIERIPNRNSPPCFLLRECYREKGKIKKRTLANVTHWPPHVVDGLRELIKGGADIEKANGGFDIIRSLPCGHVSAVFGSLRNSGLDKLISSRRCHERDLVIAMIVNRIINPCSKLATARTLNNETATTTLGMELGVEETTESDLYGAMDWLLHRQQRIEDRLARRHLQDGNLILYDVSSSYYTGTHCDLARFGHNRDGKKGFPQIVYGLLCSSDGCPVAIEVFEGNTSDPQTLNSQVRKTRDRFGLQNIILVGDRGMITSARIREDLQDEENIDWITALRSPAIRKLVEQKSIQLSLFDHRDLMEISSPDYPDERLVVCRNPLLAEERTRKREELLKATEKKLDEVVAATQREKRRLKGKDKIALRIGKVINRHKMEKHFILDITDNSFTYQRNEEKINEEKALDGLYVIRTSVEKEKMDAEEAVRAYKDLAKVERAFRSLKTVDLKIRPIFHRNTNRVKAHVFLCMLAYYVEWHMRQKLASILFDDDEKESAETLRDSIVAPAKRSPRAQKKACYKKTESGRAVHSFRTLLEELATIVKNWIKPNIPGEATFQKTTIPNAIQKEAFDLLNIKL